MACGWMVNQHKVKAQHTYDAQGQLSVLPEPHQPVSSFLAGAFNVRASSSRWFLALFRLSLLGCFDSGPLSRTLNHQLSGLVGALLSRLAAVILVLSATSGGVAIGVARTSATGRQAGGGVGTYRARSAARITFLALRRSERTRNFVCCLLSCHSLAIQMLAMALLSSRPLRMKPRHGLYSRCCHSGSCGCIKQGMRIASSWRRVFCTSCRERNLMSLLFSLASECIHFPMTGRSSVAGIHSSRWFGSCLEWLVAVFAAVGRLVVPVPRGCNPRGQAQSRRCARRKVSPCRRQQNCVLRQICT